MIWFQQFFLDREQDIVVDLYMEGDRLFHVIRTPNHHTGNLITNLARLCGLETETGEQGLLVIRKAVHRIKAGEAIGIYPEGTRSKTGALLPFRVGCFKAAQWAKCPLVVLKTENSELVEKNFLRRKTNVRLTVKAVLPYDEIADMSTVQIGEKVRNILLEA